MSILSYIISAIVLLLLVVIVVRIAKKRRISSEQHYPENEQLYVGNLSYQVNSHQLKKVFSRYGEVDTVRVIKNTKTGRSKGFAFVTYTDSKAAKKALAENGQDLRGRPMVVRMAKPRSEA